jgi:hypothetical protein
VDKTAHRSDDKISRETFSSLSRIFKGLSRFSVKKGFIAAESF